MVLAIYAGVLGLIVGLFLLLYFTEVIYDLFFLFPPLVVYALLLLPSFGAYQCAFNVVSSGKDLYRTATLLDDRTVNSARIADIDKIQKYNADLLAEKKDLHSFWFGAIHPDYLDQAKFINYCIDNGVFKLGNCRAEKE